MTHLASTILTLGLRLLPRPERSRYAEEFDSDLRSQPGWRRLAYAVSTVLGMPRLRWELLCRRAGQRVPYCFVGMHRDVSVHPNPEDAQIIARECTLCHRTRDPSQYATRLNPKGLGWAPPPHF